MSKVIIEKEIGAIPSASEMEMVDILVLHNIAKRHVLFLRPNRTKGARTPDITIDGVPWEIKSITKLSKYTVEHTLRNGLKQADSLVIDLRKLNESLESKVIARLEKEFSLTKGWRGLIVIVRFNGDCLTYSK